MAKKNEKLLAALTFLLPLRLIKQKLFSKRDVRNIKNNLTFYFGYVYFIIACVLLLLSVALTIYMFINTNGDYVGYYGFGSLLGQIILMAGSFITIGLFVVSKLIKSKSVSLLLNRIGGDILYVATASFLFCCIFADAEMGFTTQAPTLSASIIFVTILALIQPTHWIDALVLDLGTAFGLIGVSAYCKAVFGMQATYYYGLIGFLFPFAAYLVVAILFYAESQHYIDMLENDRLQNKAYYDNLTRCKNRHALVKFLDENKNRWEKGNSSLLIVLFDVDNFKEYNDQFSHLGGDYCLRSIADAIREEFPAPSLDFFRYGGEEFLLFFEVESQKEAPVVIDKVRLAISNLEIEAPKGAPKKMVTISVGGLLLQNIKSFEFEENMKIVDAYLYKAKASGKDVSCYNGVIIN